jgi:hypothetical protein
MLFIIPLKIRYNVTMKGKAGDIFLKNDGSGEKVPFAEVFPEIEALDARVTETGPGNQGLGARRFNRNSYREFINCSNVLCSGHGAPSGDILRAMVKTRQKTAQNRIVCEGREESGKRCSNVFVMAIMLTYKGKA